MLRPKVPTVLGQGVPTSGSAFWLVKVVTGGEVLQTPFDSLFVRLNPGEFQEHVTAKEMTDRPVDSRDMKRTDDLFRQEVVKSFGLDLGDLSSDTWSLLPLPGDFLAEIHTRRFDTLTYARSAGEIEDISLFDRKHRHNLSVYSSKAHLERYTRFYSDDDRLDYRVESYGVDVRFDPAQQAIAGQTSLNIEVLASSVNVLTLRLADSLAVQSVVSAEFGRMLAGYEGCHFKLQLVHPDDIAAHIDANAGAELDQNLVSDGLAAVDDLERLRPPRGTQNECCQCGGTHSGGTRCRFGPRTDGSGARTAAAIGTGAYASPRSAGGGDRGICRTECGATHADG